MFKTQPPVQPGILRPSIPNPRRNAMTNKNLTVPKIVFSIFAFLMSAVSVGFAAGEVTVQDVVGSVQYYNPTTGEQGSLEKGQQLPAECFVFAGKDGNATFTDSTGALVFLGPSSAAQLGGLMASGGKETATVEQDGDKLILQQGNNAPLTMPVSLAGGAILYLANANTFGDADKPSDSFADKAADLTFDTPPSEGN